MKYVLCADKSNDIAILEFQASTHPADQLMHDIALALMAVQTQTTEVLDTFPTIPVTQEADQILKEIGQEP